MVSAFVAGFTNPLMRDHLPLKGPTMIVHLILAIAIFLAVGVAVNIIAEFATKK